MNRSNAIITAIFAIAIAGGLYWFFTHFERYQETVSTGFQAEARHNPLLAVGRMLRTLGVDASELEASTWKRELEKPRGTLVLASRSWTLSDADLQSLLQWIENGGHVVTAPETLARPASFWRRDADDDNNTENENLEQGDAADSDADAEGTAGEDDEEASSAGALLSEFGISRFEAPLSRKERAATLPTRIDGAEIPVTFMTRTRLLVDHENFVARARDEHGLCFVELRHGGGRLSVLCSLTGLSNRWIDEHRNATFAWHLFDTHGESAPVWFLFDTDMPPLYRWLWHNMPLAVVAAAALGLFWLWSLMRRSGPLLDEEVTGSRRTLEHIDASGRFVWRYETGGALLEGMRSELRKQIERRNPTWLQLPEAELYQRLANQSNLDPVRVFHALADTPRKRTQFVAAVRDLQRLREIL